MLLPLSATETEQPLSDQPLPKFYAIKTLAGPDNVGNSDGFMPAGIAIVIAKIKRLVVGQVFRSVEYWMV